MALDLEKFIARFQDEARDHLTRLTAGLTALETAPQERAAIDELFRAAHTIKGSARMLKLDGISTTAHHLEDLLATLRAGRVASPALISLMLRGVDALAEQLDQVAAGARAPRADDALCAALAQAAAGTGPDAVALPAADQANRADRADQPAPSPAATEPTAADAPVAPPTAGAPSTSATEGHYHSPDSVRVPLAKLDELVRLIGELMGQQARLRERLRQTQALDQAARPLATTSAAAATQAAALHRLARQLRDDCQTQEVLTASLGERALLLRMLPLSMVFDPAARMVRELARDLGKEARCAVQGGSIELDRQLIEGVGEALLHCLRNAVDHGIEPPAERRAAGKPAAGQVRLSARLAGGGVVIEIADDGRGLDQAKLRAKAVQKGLLDAAAAAALSDDEALELVYSPGFSTSEIITDLSGRGVGMDVIKHTVIDQLHGTVHLTSQPGAGTRVQFKLPLSLAVMRMLLLTAGGQCFALAAQHVVELIRFSPAATIRVAERPAVVLRNEFIPLLPLAELLQRPAGQPAGGEPNHRAQTRLALIIGVRQTKLGLIIDGLVDTRDLVIKALPAHLRGCGLVGGIVVTGDNQLISVLQAPSLLEAARRCRAEGTARSAAAQPQARDGPWRVLVVDDSLNTREIIREVLEAYGYRVTTAEDGLDGWQKASGGGFDAVLTDVEMPGLDGFSLTARLREHPHYQSVPILIITSRQNEEDKRRGVQVGADAYIVKGDFDQSSLLDTLHALLGETA